MTGMAATNAQGIMGSYNPQTATNQYKAPGLQTANINNLQMQGPQSYTGNNVNQYMSPYMNDVVKQQSNAAVRNYADSLPQLASAVTNAGGLGGSRETLLQGQQQQNLQNQLANIQATGSQAAFQNAQQQFNTQQQMQQGANAQNLQAGLTAQGQNLSQAQGLNSAGIQSAGMGAQYGLGAQQLNAQQQQFGSNLNLGANQQLLNSGAQMGQLGQNQYNQQMGILDAQNQIGTQQQGVAQNVNNALNQNFQNYQNYPYAQQAFLSGILHGTSPGALGSQGSTSSYQQSPNTLGQVGGLTAGLAGLYGASVGGH
jgi:hypothetical protein